VGGNLSRGSELSITTSVLGTCSRAVLRSGAAPGDTVWIAGSVGLATAGLRALVEGRAAHPDLDVAIGAFRRPPIHALAGAALGKVAHAAIDVSDGLSQDISHLARASNVAVVLHGEALLAHAGEALDLAAKALRQDPLALVLDGGEDYALVATSDLPMPGFTAIGRVVEGTGVRLLERGREKALDPRGFDHFAPSR
jgi:thiamine-monophosphate kinase